MGRQVDERMDRGYILPPAGGLGYFNLDSFISPADKLPDQEIASLIPVDGKRASLTSLSLG